MSHKTPIKARRIKATFVAKSIEVYGGMREDMTLGFWTIDIETIESQHTKFIYLSTHAPFELLHFTTLYACTYKI